MEGKKILRSIQYQKNLCDLFNELDVDVYFATKINKVGDLYYIEEPTQQSNNLKKMKGVLSIQPEITF